MEILRFVTQSGALGLRLFLFILTGLVGLLEDLSESRLQWFSAQDAASPQPEKLRDSCNLGGSLKRICRVCGLAFAGGRV